MPRAKHAAECYMRLTREVADRLSRLDSKHNIYVKIVMGYTIFGLLAIEIPYFFILCRPFAEYWALPVKSPQCASYFYYCIIQMVFNISSDLLMLAIPLPFVINAKVPPLKRAVLVAIFSLGIFIIMAATLNKYNNFVMPNTTVYMKWDIRETSTSIFVSNIMCLWPLLRKIFGWRAFQRNSSAARSTQTPEPRASITALKVMSPPTPSSSHYDQSPSKWDQFPPKWDDNEDGGARVYNKEVRSIVDIGHAV